MSKHFFEDMVRDKRQRLGVKEVKKGPELREIWNKEKAEDGDGEKKPRYLLWLVAAISVVFCLFALSLLFAKATVSVNPRAESFTLNENLTAVKDSGGDGLVFDLVALSGEEKKVIPASGEKEVSERATGTAIIYNTYGSSSQTLLIDTRLEGSNGKIYKTQARTVVPGKSKSGTPGSVEVKIYGAEAGEEYNSAPLDFKILGFKGTAKYEGFYGRSKGSVAGGFKGMIPDVPEAEKNSAVEELSAALREELFQKAANQVPPGFVLFRDSTFLDTENEDIPFAAENGNLTVAVKGTLYGILFNEQKLVKKITKENVKDYDDSEIFIPNIGNLVFTLAGKDGASLSEMQSISFNLSGPAKIIWKLDEKKFVADLLGKPKKDFNQALYQYPNVESAILTLRPFWIRSVPDEAKDVKVMVNYN